MTKHTGSWAKYSTPTSTKDRAKMQNENYKKAIDVASRYASSGPEWNARFELSLLKQGLKIVSEQPQRHPLNNDLMAPIPVEGEHYTYPYPSWIIEL